MMRRTTVEPSRSSVAGWATKVAVVAGVALSVSATACAADDAAQILKAMSDYVGSQKSISATFDSDIEVITPDLQKIQFTSSGQVQLARPDRMRVRRTGGYADVELVYDGKTVTLSGNNTNAYVQQDMSGSVDQMIDQVQAKLGAAMPGTDLLLTNSYDELMGTCSMASISAKVSSTASNASISPFATPTRIGRSGWKRDRSRYPASM
jgi:hypothetical protein